MTAPRSHETSQDAADRFIAGEDRLSALLRELTPFVAPESLGVAVGVAARALEARVAAEAEQRSATTSPPPLDLTFAAPPSLSANVLREAARLQAAQAARRDAVFEQVRQGKEAADILGAPVGKDAQAWLRAQAEANEGTRRVAPTVQPNRANPMSRWWKSLGLAASAFAVAGLATQIVLKQLDDGTSMTASLSSNVTLADAPLAAAPKVEASAVAATPAVPALDATPALSSVQREPAAPSVAQAAPSAPSDAAAAMPFQQEQKRNKPTADTARRPTTPSPTARKESAQASATSGAIAAREQVSGPPGIAPDVSSAPSPARADVAAAYAPPAPALAPAPAAAAPAPDWTRPPAPAPALPPALVPPPTQARVFAAAPVSPAAPMAAMQAPANTAESAPRVTAQADAAADARARHATQPAFKASGVEAQGAQGGSSGAVQAPAPAATSTSVPAAAPFAPPPAALVVPRGVDASGGASTTTRASGTANASAKASTVTIEADPAAVAMQWRPGKALRIWSAEPGNAAVRDWVARLWGAMPAEVRPAAPYPIQLDDTLARGQLRIEQMD